MEQNALIHADNGIVLAVPQGARGPYELLVAPEGHEGDAFASERLSSALHLLVDGLRRLLVLEGPVPLNAWLHTAPFGADGHWHIEAVPRLSTLAGLELGAGIYVNTLAPDDAAKRLRAAAP